MRYRLGDICTITKGEMGIMKAIPGTYTMVALGEANKTHNEYQFDAKAVIIPLVSSTGHGHASMKRVKYQEGKFALGNILCAVIPKDENFVLAKYLQIYLHWNREELLVSQMKGMANVSLPMNRIADVEVIVPSIEKQRQVVELEAKLVEKELEADKLFADQLTQLDLLNQAILQEAVQGKLVTQNPTDEPASQLLKSIKTEKETLIKSKKLKAGKSTEQSVSLIDNYNIPQSWLWCKTDDVFFVTKLAGFEYTEHIQLKETGEIPVVRAQNIRPLNIDKTNLLYIDSKTSFQLDRCSLTKKCLLVTFIGAGIGDVATFNEKERWHLAPNVAKMEPFEGCENLIDVKFVNYFLMSNIGQKELFKHIKATAQPSLSMGTIRDIDIPIPPLSEQTRIVAEIEKQLAKIKQLKEHIIANQQATEQLLKALLHEAFEVREAKEVKIEKQEAKVIQFKPRKCNESERAILAGHIINLNNCKDFGRVKFQKLLHLTEYHCKIDLDSHYFQKVAGPYDEELIKNIESALQRYRFYSIKQDNTDVHKVTYSALAAANELETFFTEHFSEDVNRINGFILKFKNSSWEQCEIVSTLYAVWNNRIIKRLTITDETLKQDFLNWHKQKAKYKTRLDDALAWMKENNIIPDGWGNYIDKPRLG